MWNRRLHRQQLRRSRVASLPQGRIMLSQPANQPAAEHPVRLKASRPQPLRRHRSKIGCAKPGTSKAEIAYAEGVSLDWNRGALAEGLACYSRGEFFFAHEHWEIVWLTLEEPEKSFLQALIQVTAAFHHLHAGNSAGALSLLRRALQRLELCPANFRGIAVKPLRAELSEWVLAIERGSSSLPAAPPQILPLEHD